MSYTRLDVGSVKKTAIAAAMALSLGTGMVQAFPVVDFSYSGTFTMYTPTGAVWGGDPALTGGMSIDMGTGAGTAAISPSTLFSGYMWTAHNITLQVTGPGAATADMLFDWNGNLNIPVRVDFSMTPTAPCNLNDMSCFDVGDSLTLATQDGNDPNWSVNGNPRPQPDSIPGYPMVSGPFPGWNATFGGTVTVTSVDPGPGQVPVPGAAWLFGSGLMGLAGIVRRHKESRRAA